MSSIISEPFWECITRNNCSELVANFLGRKLKGVAYLEFLPGKFAAVQLLRSCNGAVIRLEIASRDLRTNVFGRTRLVRFIL